MVCKFIFKVIIIRFVYFLKLVIAIIFSEIPPICCYHWGKCQRHIQIAHSTCLYCVMTVRNMISLCYPVRLADGCLTDVLKSLLMQTKPTDSALHYKLAFKKQQQETQSVVTNPGQH